MTHDIVQTSAADTLPPFDPATFWAQFRHDTVAVKDVRLHFVEGGSGAPILLLPGWPQSWYAWRYVMALLAPGCTVIRLGKVRRRIGTRHILPLPRVRLLWFAKCA